jgi:lipoate-protein ligase A
VLNGKKVIGSAQTRIKDGLLQHGSLLLSLDIDENLNILNLKEGQREKVEKILKVKATSLSQEGFNYNFNELKEVLAEKMAENFCTKGYWGELTKEEKELAEKLYREKYSTESWNFKK